MSNTHVVRARGRAVIAALLAAALLLLAFAASAFAGEAPGETFPVSVTESGAFAEGEIVPGGIALSADGRDVAFTATAENLTGAAGRQVYVKDLQTGAVTLASRASGAAGEPADEPALAPCEEQPEPRVALSADGRYVVFTSDADNLVPGLPLEAEETELECAQAHAYRRDLQTGLTEMVDRVSVSGEMTDHRAVAAALSADGRYVLFDDRAENLGEAGAEHEAGELTVYLRDLEAGTTTAVSRASGAAGALADSDAHGVQLAADGRFVTFTSAAENLVAGPVPAGREQLYLRELQAPFTTELLSQGSGDEAGDEGPTSSALVGIDDCEVAFGSRAQNLVAGAPFEGVYLRDRCAAPPSTTLISLDEEAEPFEAASVAGATATGKVAVAAEAIGGNPAHLYLLDPAAGTELLLDRASGADGAVADAPVGAAAISADGCRAVFVSEATNLTATAPPAGATRQIYARQIPCEPPAVSASPPAEPAPPSPPSGGPTAPTAATKVRAGHLSPKALWLVFDGAGRSKIRVQRLIVGRHHGWHRIKFLTVTAAAAGPIKVALPRLASGRYRLKFRLQGDPDNPTLTRRLMVGGG